jgi:hypothetical protein
MTRRAHLPRTCRAPAARACRAHLLFRAYGYYGGYLPLTWAIAHAGPDFDQIVDSPLHLRQRLLRHARPTPCGCTAGRTRR